MSELELCDYCGKLRDKTHNLLECHLFVVAIAEGRIESSRDKRAREKLAEIQKRGA